VLLDTLAKLLSSSKGNIWLERDWEVRLIFFKCVSLLLGMLPENSSEEQNPMSKLELLTRLGAQGNHLPLKREGAVELARTQWRTLLADEEGRLVEPKQPWSQSHFTWLGHELVELLELATLFSFFSTGSIVGVEKCLFESPLSNKIANEHDNGLAAHLIYNRLIRFKDHRFVVENLKTSVQRFPSEISFLKEFIERSTPFSIRLHLLQVSSTPDLDYNSRLALDCALLYSEQKAQANAEKPGELHRQVRRAFERAAKSSEDGPVPDSYLRVQKMHFAIGEDRQERVVDEAFHQCWQSAPWRRLFFSSGPELNRTMHWRSSGRS